MSEEDQEMSSFMYASDLNCLQNIGDFVSQLSLEILFIYVDSILYVKAGHFPICS